ncbi:MAG: phosphotransferase [Nitrosomonadaceae bacterium]|nr:phosphotransferase [Nitrosomonadaceae bacterium]
MQRLQLLESWLKTQFPGKSFTLSPASADASFRRYFRATFNDGTLIIMDAPPQQEDCTHFINIAKTFAMAGVHVPEVLAQDLTQGFLLLSDLGSTTYLQALSDAPGSADQLYCDAVDALIKIQLASRPGVLPDYDATLLLRELNLFPDWYVAKHLQAVLSAEQKVELTAVFTRILQNNLAQPRVFVHRDYHSRNLMLTLPNPGILDFQDAVYGPVTYDLVSLFKDAYIRWDEERVLDWLIRYWEKARKAELPVAADFAGFYRDFEWMGVQRHIKVLGIFARLAHRDGKDSYRRDMPLVMDYLRKACKRYRELGPLLLLLDALAEDKPDATIGYSF